MDTNEIITQNFDLTSEAVNRAYDDNCKLLTDIEVELHDILDSLTDHDGKPLPYISEKLVDALKSISFSIYLKLETVDQEKYNVLDQLIDKKYNELDRLV